MEKEKDIALIAKIAVLDRELYEMEEELGDLPKLIQAKNNEIADKKSKISETENYISDVRNFVTASKLTIASLKEQEDKLSKQQFLVRNNKEFDAITMQLQTIKIEYDKLSARMRTEGVKENGLVVILENQNRDLKTLQTELDELQEQLDKVSVDNNDRFQYYIKKRNKISSQIDDRYLFEKYETIHNRIPDAAVIIKNDACNGCYRQIPQQVIVEMRNQLDRIFQCEYCGRILIPEWVEINEEELLED